MFKLKKQKLFIVFVLVMLIVGGGVIEAAKIEFAAHLIKLSSQIGENICGYFRDKHLIQYFSRCDIFCNMPHS